MNLLIRLQQPETIISICVFIFSLGWIRATLNNRIKDLEIKMKEIDSIDIKTRLAEIQSDLSWIRGILDKINKE